MKEFLWFLWGITPFSVIAPVFRNKETDSMLSFMKNFVRSGAGMQVLALAAIFGTLLIGFLPGGFLVGLSVGAAIAASFGLAAAIMLGARLIQILPSLASLFWNYLRHGKLTPEQSDELSSRMGYLFFGDSKQDILRDYMSSEQSIKNRLDRVLDRVAAEQNLLESPEDSNALQRLINTLLIKEEQEVERDGEIKKTFKKFGIQYGTIESGEEGGYTEKDVAKLKEQCVEENALYFIDDMVVRRDDKLLSFYNDEDTISDWLLKVEQDPSSGDVEERKKLLDIQNKFSTPPKANPRFIWSNILTPLLILGASAMLAFAMFGGSNWTVNGVAGLAAPGQILMTGILAAHPAFVFALVGIGMVLIAHLIINTFKFSPPRNSRFKAVDLSINAKSILDNAEKRKGVLRPNEINDLQEAYENIQELIKGGIVRPEGRQELTEEQVGEADQKFEQLMSLIEVLRAVPLPEASSSEEQDDELQPLLELRQLAGALFENGAIQELAVVKEELSNLLIESQESKNRQERLGKQREIVLKLIEEIEKGGNQELQETEIDRLQNQLRFFNQQEMEGRAQVFQIENQIAVAKTQQKQLLAALQNNPQLRENIRALLDLVQVNKAALQSREEQTAFNLDASAGGYSGDDLDLGARRSGGGIEIEGDEHQDQQNPLQRLKALLSDENAGQQLADLRKFLNLFEPVTSDNIKQLAQDKYGREALRLYFQQWNGTLAAEVSLGNRLESVSNSSSSSSEGFDEENQLLGQRSKQPQTGPKPWFNNWNNRFLLGTSAVFLALATSLVYAVFGGLIVTMGALSLALPIAAILGFASFVMAKKVFQDSPDDPYMELGLLVGAGFTVLITITGITFLPLWSSTALLFSVGASLSWLPAVLGISALIVAGCAFLSTRYARKSYAERENESNVEWYKPTAYKIAKGFHIFIKLGMLAGSLLLGYIGMGSLFNFDAGFLGIQGGITQYIFGVGTALVPNNFVLVYNLLSIFSVITIAVAITFAVLLVKSLLRDFQPKNAEDYKKWKPRLDAMGIAFKLGVTIGLMIALWATLPALGGIFASPFLFPALLIVAALMPVVTGNTSFRFLSVFFAKETMEKINKWESRFNLLFGVKPFYDANNNPHIGKHVIREVVWTIVLVGIPAILFAFAAPGTFAFYALVTLVTGGSMAEALRLRVVVPEMMRNAPTKPKLDPILPPPPPPLRRDDGLIVKVIDPPPVVPPKKPNDKHQILHGEIIIIKTPEHFRPALFRTALIGRIQERVGDLQRILHSSSLSQLEIAHINNVLESILQNVNHISKEITYSYYFKNDATGNFQPGVKEELIFMGLLPQDRALPTRGDTPAVMKKFMNSLSLEQILFAERFAVLHKFDTYIKSKQLQEFKRQFFGNQNIGQDAANSYQQRTTLQESEEDMLHYQRVFFLKQFELLGDNEVMEEAWGDDEQSQARLGEIRTFIVENRNLEENFSPELRRDFYRHRNELQQLWQKFWERGRQPNSRELSPRYDDIEGDNIEEKIEWVEQKLGGVRMAIELINPQLQDIEEQLNELGTQQDGWKENLIELMQDVMNSLPELLKFRLVEPSIQDLFENYLESASWVEVTLKDEEVQDNHEQVMDIWREFVANHRQLSDLVRQKSEHSKTNERLTHESEYYTGQKELLEQRQFLHEDDNNITPKQQQRMTEKRQRRNQQQEQQRTDKMQRRNHHQQLTDELQRRQLSPSSTTTTTTTSTTPSSSSLFSSPSHAPQASFFGIGPRSRPQMSAHSMPQSEQLALPWLEQMPVKQQGLWREGWEKFAPSEQANVLKVWGELGVKGQREKIEELQDLDQGQVIEEVFKRMGANPDIVDPSPSPFKRN